MLPGLSEIGRCFSVEVRRSFGRFIVSRLWVLVGGEGESVDDLEFWLEAGGYVGLYTAAVAVKMPSVDSIW